MISMEYEEGVFTISFIEEKMCIRDRVNTLCTVLLMSILLTIIGSWIGTRSITLEPIRLFFYKWPRNFAISLFVELCIAQLAARLAILKLHLRKEAGKEE